MTISGIQTFSSDYSGLAQRGTIADRRPTAVNDGARAPGATPGSGQAVSAAEPLSPEAVQEVTRLKQRDAEVKAHEQAHMAAGGSAVQGGARYTFEKGPDGRQYAVGGEVSIDTSPENAADATIRKMQMVKRAALAPADPSAQDRSVAAKADSTAAKARAEMAQEDAAGENSGDTVASGISPAKAARRYMGAPPAGGDSPPTVDLSI